MSVSLKSCMPNILLFVIFLLLGACSSKKETQKVKPASPQISFNNIQDTTVYVDTAKTYDYDSWSTAQYKNIKIIFPEGHPFTEKMQDYAQIYKTVLRRDFQFFRLPEPTDSITIFYYTGFGQGQDLANSEFPTVRGDSIYYWPGNRLGITAAMYALKQWTKIDSQYKFLYHGILRLLDASGRNYHVTTLSFIDSTKFIYLQDLIKDTRVNYNAEAYQSAEAASFIDYFIYKYGIDNFKLLYESPREFEPTIQTICNINLDTLEKDWLRVIRQAMKKKK